MYTIPCLQVAYEFLNREWMFLIYGAEKKTWYKSFRTWIDKWNFNILHSSDSKNDYLFRSNNNYQFLLILFIISLGAIFTACMIIKELLSLDAKKYFTEFQCWRNDKLNKMFPAFRENSNENLQLTKDLISGTSLTAIVKPTMRNTHENVKATDVQPNYEKKNTNSRLTSSKNLTSCPKPKKEDKITESEHNNRLSGIEEWTFVDMGEMFQDSVQNENTIKPLIKCSSSLRVVTSKDSINAEFRSQFIIKNTISPPVENQKKDMQIVNNTNNNLTFGIHETSSVFQVDDVISSMLDDTMSHYRCSISAYPSPDTATVQKNSSYASGHFVEHFPDLDLSPIAKNRCNEQSLKIESTDKEVEEMESKETGRKSSYRRSAPSHLPFSPTSPEQGSEFFLSCIGCKTCSPDKKKFNQMQSKIPRPYFFVESTEANEELTKLDAFDVTKSKIPIPLRKCPTSNVSAGCVLNEFLQNVGPIQVEQKKGTETCDHLESTESELSLQRFVQLEIETGCYKASR